MRRAQSTLEYSILIAIVAAAIITMRTYVQRSVQANIKTIEQQINAEIVRAPMSSGPSGPTLEDERQINGGSGALGQALEQIGPSDEGQINGGALDAAREQIGRALK